jgi:hypothetical protein
MVTQQARDPSGGRFDIPATYPRADGFLQMPHDLRRDTAVNVFSFAGVLPLPKTL